MQVRLTMPMIHRQQLQANGRTVHLTPTELRLVEIMLLRQGRRTSCSDLLDMLYSDRADGGPEEAYQILRIHMHNVNRKVGGRLLFSQHSDGYQIDAAA